MIPTISCPEYVADKAKRLNNYGRSKTKGIRNLVCLETKKRSVRFGKCIAYSLAPAYCLPWNRSRRKIRQEGK